jgi:hypothetical protein
MADKKRLYVEPQPIERAAAEAAFKSPDAAVVCRALVGVAYHDPDWKWVQSRCLELLFHVNPDVRGLAATCLGHVARIHRRLDAAAVKAALAEARKDPLVAGYVDDALDDIKAYIK